MHTNKKDDCQENSRLFYEKVCVKKDFLFN